MSKYRLTGMPKTMDLSKLHKEANNSDDPLKMLMKAAAWYNTMFNTPHVAHRIPHWEIGVIEIKDET